MGRNDVPNSVIEAIQLGIWDYEPDSAGREDFLETDALPGTDEKLSILADRLSQGKPLWHPNDRLNFIELSVDDDIDLL